MKDMIFVIPDTHLGDEGIKKYCNRPDNFEKLIEKNWNEIITDNDTVLHLGDMALDEFWIKRLGNWNGKKILVRGNHDKMPSDFYMNVGFSAVVEEITMDINNLIILFSHRPKFDHDCDVNIHGHQHNLAVYDNKRLYLPLSIEHMGYKPLALDENFVEALKKFVLKNQQPTLKEIMALGQNSIGTPNIDDFYGWFDEETFEEYKFRLEKCYQILNNPPYNSARYKYRLWQNANLYIESKISEQEFHNAISQFL